MRILYMDNRDYERYWADPKQPLREFGAEAFSKGRARAMVGFQFVEWALRQGLLEENEDGLLRLSGQAGPASS